MWCGRVKPCPIQRLFHLRRLFAPCDSSKIRMPHSLKPHLQRALRESEMQREKGKWPGAKRNLASTPRPNSYKYGGGGKIHEWPHLLRLRSECDGVDRNMHVLRATTQRHIQVNERTLRSFFPYSIVWPTANIILLQLM
jgi:hypothetical protein